MVATVVSTDDEQRQAIIDPAGCVRCGAAAQDALEVLNHWSATAMAPVTGMAGRTGPGPCEGAVSRVPGNKRSLTLPKIIGLRI